MTRMHLFGYIVCRSRNICDGIGAGHSCLNFSWYKGTGKVYMWALDGPVAALTTVVWFEIESTHRSHSYTERRPRIQTKALIMLLVQSAVVLNPSIDSDQSNSKSASRGGNHAVQSHYDHQIAIGPHYLRDMQGRLPVFPHRGPHPTSVLTGSAPPSSLYPDRISAGTHCRTVSARFPLLPCLSAYTRSSFRYRGSGLTLQSFNRLRHPRPSAIPFLRRRTPAP